MAWMDVEKAVEAVAEKQIGLAWAYGASAVVGLAAAAAILVGWTGVGLILVAVLIGIAVFIEYFKDNKLQDWLERCFWGRGPSPRHDSVETEMSEFKKAVA